MVGFFLAVLVSITAVAADFVVPSLTGPVVDQAGMFSESTRQSLARFLHQVQDQSGTQLEVATVADLAGLSIEEASIKIVDAWKLGRRKEDRGILLLFAPTEHKVRIEVGRGLEGDVPDAIASRIVSEVIVPRLKNGANDRAAIDGVVAILHYSDPDVVESGHTIRGPHGHAAGGDFMAILFWIIVSLFTIGPIFSRRMRRSVGGPGIFWWGGGGGFGGGSWGGGSGGGWSGGGGGFSGGGASGGW